MLIHIVREWRRRKLNARELERINASSDRLNVEAEDVLNYQVDDEMPDSES